MLNIIVISPKYFCGSNAYRWIRANDCSDVNAYGTWSNIGNK